MERKKALITYQDGLRTIEIPNPTNIRIQFKDDKDPFDFYLDVKKHKLRNIVRLMGKGV